MSYRIEYVQRADTFRQRRPRVKEGGHLENIRLLPCVVCGTWPVEAAHIRASSRKHGKRETGISEKSSDKWTLPLCPDHHRAQHQINEREFWVHWGIDSFATALSLWAADGDLKTMMQIIQAART